MTLTRFPNLEIEYTDLALKSGIIPYARHKQIKASSRRAVFTTHHSIVLVLNGRKQVHFNANTVDVEPSQVLMLRQGIYLMNELLVEDTYEALILFFTNKSIKEFLMKHRMEGVPPKETEPISHVVVPNHPLIESFRDNYMTYFNHANEHMESLLQLKLEELVLLLLSGPSKNQVLNLFRQLAQSEPIDLDYIVRQNLFQPINTDELARLSGRSLASFKRDFQERYNSPPRKWINEQRLDYAQMQLNNSDKTISEIAHECGFESVPHFIRLFKKEYATTPQAYRTKTAMV